jgi:PPK2 family polyphosphate:nucleotide phosphotransferase
MGNKSRINLSKFSTRAPKDLDKDETKAKTGKLIEKLADLQNVMYAENKWSLLIVLQGMDASGKDGAVKSVFRGINPLGCRVYPFKAPTQQELAHDFLWRVHQQTPARGMIQIFNRSHYEDVLITRVHRWISDETARERFRYINAFEECVQSAGTIILKFYLHISREEQAERFAERKIDPWKRWKYNPGDLKESKLWDDYMEAYEDAIAECSPKIPWMVVPSDQNWYKEYLIADTIVDHLQKLDMKYPGLPEEEDH